MQGYTMQGLTCAPHTSRAPTDHAGLDSIQAAAQCGILYMSATPPEAQLLPHILHCTIPTSTQLTTNQMLTQIVRPTYNPAKHTAGWQPDAEWHTTLARHRAQLYGFFSNDY